MSSTRGDAVKMEREEAGATPRASKLSAAHADVQIPLASLPQYVQEQLAEFDTDGNGIISLAEILRHGAELQHSKRSVTAYRRVIVLLLFVWAASIAAIFGVVTAGVAITRQTLVHSGSPAMMTRDGLIVQTQAALETQDTSSALPDTVWQRLKYFNLEGSNNSWLQLDVLSTARVYGTGSLGSIMRVYTSTGVVTVDGEQLSFSSDLTPVLTDIGYFNATPAGRHLLRPRGSLMTTA